MAKKYESRHFAKPSIVRNVIIAVAFVAIVMGMVLSGGLGTLSAWGYDSIMVICPLGALEAQLGLGAFVPHLVLLLIIALIIITVVGKAFCAWGCPVPPFSRFFMTKKAKEKQASEQRKAATNAYQKQQCEKKSCSACSQTKASWDSRHFVLLGALGSTALFGFPVFCLICPLGLIFATVMVIIRLVGFNEPSWGLLIFPAIILFELVFLPKWCHRFCPLGALMSILSRFNKTLRPRVDDALCVRYTNDEECLVCAAVCPELIDIHNNKGLRSMTECIKCNCCSEACPQGAIRFTSHPFKWHTNHGGTIPSSLNGQTKEVITPSLSSSEKADD